jgi:uncharacterized protein YdhG (YjbR/CyaY superfamily)
MTSAKKTTGKAARKTASARSASLSAEERAAVKERAAELKAEAKRGKDRAAGERELLAKIAEMPPEDRALAEGIHAIVTKAAPDLDPKTWYGMPAWARDGKNVVFFQSAAKSKERYATLGFTAAARLDDGNLWPTSYAVTKLTKADEAAIRKLVEQAVG